MGKNQRKPHKQGRNTHRSGKSGSSSPEVVVADDEPVEKLWPKNLPPPPPVFVEGWETRESARERFKNAKKDLLDRARYYDLVEKVSLSRATMSEIEVAKWFGILNYDVVRGDKGDQMMNMDNCCIQWAAFKLWRSIAAGADAAEAIAAAGVLFDNFLFRMEVSRGKKRLCPAEEFVALCGGDIAIATELATLHRDYVVAALALNVAARGAKANVVSFGDVAEAYVAKQLAPTGLVDVAGRFPHPEALLSLKGDVQAKIKNGKIFNAPTKREIYVAADSAAAAIARICGFRVVVTFHVDLYEGHGDLLGELAALRSKRMEDVWASLSDEEYAAWCANIAIGVSGVWASLSAKDRAAKCSAIREAMAAMSAEAKAKLAATRKANGKAQFAEGKCQGLIKKGDTLSEATKAKMTAAKRTDSTKVWVCPSCGFDTTKPSLVLRKHFHNEPLKGKNFAEFSEDCNTWLCEKVQAGDTAALKEALGPQFRKYI